MANFIEAVMNRVLGRLGYYKVNPYKNTLQSTLESNPRSYFDLLDAYYRCNALYDAATIALRNISTGGEPIKALRNPANRVVEFYACTIWPGDLPAALPIVADNKRINEPITQLWQWSNWAENKQVAIRQLATSGDLFIKIATRNDGRPYMQTIAAKYVSMLETDERGFLTQIRIDTPIDPAPGSITQRTHTELWTVDELKIWEHGQGDAAIDNLGAPMSTTALAEMGIDFVPIAMAKFRDVGDLHGVGAFVHALDKIDETNRSASRLNSMLFKNNKTLWAVLQNAVDPNGRPLPQAKVTGDDGKTALNIADLERDAMITLPGAADIKSLVPDLKYGDALAILKDTIDEIRSDLPEMLFWDLVDNVSRDASGASVEMRLRPAISRAIEARGNAERCLARAHQMALTIGQTKGVWRGLGTYEAGDLAHSFAERDILKTARADIVANERAMWDAAKAAQNVGAGLDTSLPRLGWAKPEVDAVIASDDYKARRALVDAGTQASRRPA